MRFGPVLGRPGQSTSPVRFRGPGPCPLWEGTGWNEALLMCCWGDGQCSGQESGPDIKARRGCVPTTRPGPCPPGPALSLWRTSAGLFARLTALAGQRGAQGADGFCLSRAARDELAELGPCSSTMYTPRLSARQALPQVATSPGAGSGVMKRLHQNRCVQIPVLPLAAVQTRGRCLTP